MTMDFSSSAGAATDFDLLPKGLLVWANLNVKGVQTSATPSRYIEVELTVDQGQPFAGRKLWDKIGDPFFEGNSEKYRQMGQVAITRILEAGRGAGPNNPAGYKIDDFAQLSGLRVPIKVGIEGGTDGHDDKNRVSEWLTPNPASQSGFKGFQKLAAGDHGLAAATTATPATQSGFGGATAPVTHGASTGFGGTAPSAQPTGQSGFGAPGGAPASGFQQPQTANSAPGGASGADSATGQSSTGFASTGSAMSQSPSDAPNWLAQAGSQAAPQ